MTVTAMRTVADAQATLAVLETRGWGQGSWCERDRLTGEPKRQFCLGGAMTWAITEGFSVSPNGLRGQQYERFQALAQAMGLPEEAFVVAWVVRYNDTVAETVTDVRYLLTRAITRLEAGI